MGNQIILIKEGQLVIGREKLSEALNIPETTIERLLKMLENGQQIGQQKTTKYRVITILNWKEYQETDSKVDNKRTTNGHIQELKELEEDTADSAEIRISPSQSSSPPLAERSEVRGVTVPTVGEEEYEDDVAIVATNGDGDELTYNGFQRAPKVPKMDSSTKRNEALLRQIEAVYKKKFLARPKQYRALNTMYANGITTAEIEQCIDDMVGGFYKDKGWDMMTVLGELSKR